MAYYPPTDWELKDFYREHVDSLYRSCCFLTCGQGDAQKMTEQILLSLLNKGIIFSSDKDARAWMFLKAYKMSRKPPKPILDEETVEQVYVLPQESDEDKNDTEPEHSGDAVLNIPEENSPEEASEKTDAAQCDNRDESVTFDADEEVSDPVFDKMQKIVSTVQFPEEFCKLSRKDRLIALMYYCESYRKAEIANYLGWPTFRVNNRLSRIKKRILSEKGVAETC